jgi:hydrogenase expression/formation protein HypE
MILLDHGSGGQLTNELIEQVFVKNFGTENVQCQTDSALLEINANNIAFTTDSYVVNPIFFPGGNIGKLSICGTINDLAVVGATPLYISCGFIIEEGLSIKDLEIIVKSMATEAKKANVKIVTGDTKVVEKGSCDKLFINTTGIGIHDNNHKNIATGSDIKPGDKIIINGYIAEHGIAVMGKRNEFKFETEINSDCASLHQIIGNALKSSDNIRFMRDATRGGVATVLCELAKNKSFGIQIYEDSIPLNDAVQGYCEILGFDPLYIANEGKVVMIVAAEDANNILTEMRKDPLGQSACIIGEIISDAPGKVILNTELGTKRIINMLTGNQLPRIC